MLAETLSHRVRNEVKALVGTGRQSPPEQGLGTMRNWNATQAIVRALEAQWPDHYFYAAGWRHGDGFNRYNLCVGRRVTAADLERMVWFVRGAAMVLGAPVDE